MYVIALVLAIALCIACVTLLVLVHKRSDNLPELRGSLGDAQLVLEHAASPLARARGLSYRDELPEGRGMLFTFGRPQRHSFWMKGMRFPIDIVWLREGVVVDVTPDVQPQGDASIMDLRTYVPEVPADEVVELPAGYAAARGIGKGDRLVLRQ